MNRTVYGALLVGVGLVAGLWLGWRGERSHVETADGRLGGVTSASGQGIGVAEITRLERRIELLASKLGAEADQRRRVEQRLESLVTELAALRGSGQEAPQAVAAVPAPAVAAQVTNTAPSSAVEPASAPEAVSSVNSMERALLAAGIDANTATEIRRRRDELSLSEIYLRDQASREGWMDTPDFTAKMAEIDRQRTSIRDDIGDEAYDRYLAALEQPNRVAVNEVMLESPAAAAGIQAGDVVLRYGDTRIFAPGELVTATRSGTAGEAVQVQIIRQGQRFEIQVPRGPLGISIAASRGDPGEG